MSEDTQKYLGICCYGGVKTRQACASCSKWEPAEKFIRINYQGSYCIIEPRDLNDMLDEGDEDYTIEEIYMTRRKFNNLPEFDGF